MAQLQKQILKYTLLPGFLPRLHSLFASGFKNIAWAMAYIYYTVRLLPQDHPYLNPNNIGRYGIHNVIAEAARNLTFDRKHIDQICIFALLGTGLILLIAQFSLLIFAIITGQPAFAEVAFPTIKEMFTVNQKFGGAQDLSFILFDQIFGLKDTFGSCISDLTTKCQDINGNEIHTPTAYPYPFHIALHQLLAFYSYGIFAVGLIVILYFITVLIGETATTGSPFGQRYNKTWAPLRLILFFALLAPLSGEDAGINAAQRITLTIAKTGSVFATNSWIYFNETLTDTYAKNAQNILVLGKGSDLIAEPNFPEINELIKFMSIVQACKIIEPEIRKRDHLPDGIQPYLIRSRQFLSGNLTSDPDHLNMEETTYDKARKHANEGDIVIRFGSFNDYDSTPRLQKIHQTFTAKVKPVCGEIIIPANAGDLPVSEKLNELYYRLVLDLWNDTEILKAANCLVHDRNTPACKSFLDGHPLERSEHYHTFLATELRALIDQAGEDHNDWNIPDKLMEKGWAGAALWYNRVAALNGEVTSAVYKIPQPSKYPFVMELVANIKKLDAVNLSPEEMFNLDVGGGQELEEKMLGDKDAARMLSNIYNFWNTGGHYERDFLQSTGNAFIDITNWIFGSSGVFDMYKNPNVNPLAQLSSIGKSLIDSSVRNIAGGFAGGLLSKLLSGVPETIVNMLSGFAKTMGFATLAIGFIMYYILPIMPFIYFTFAVSGWVKSIFEAIVAMPLWALAHITHMEGEGVSGPGAQAGYFLLFEIFLRPIMILFSLIASISIFSAGVLILNDIFKIAIDTAMGTDQIAQLAPNSEKPPESQGTSGRGAIDTFFFTGMYVVICYMFALSCFKLIDGIPNSILRWMGQSTKTFQEGIADPVEQLTGRTWKGISFLSGQVKSGGALAQMM